MKKLSSVTVTRAITEQKTREGVKDLQSLRPIDHGTIAQPHTPVYKIHRYFARRPYSVFDTLVQHYSNAGSILLDPFCGGGVTVIEGLRNRRKVVGVDLNPLATFITEMEATSYSKELLEKLYQKLRKNIPPVIEKFYLTECPKCCTMTPLYWMQWAYIFECPHCKKQVAINELYKKASGVFKCKYCQEDFQPINAKKVGETPFEIEVRCRKCKEVSTKVPDEKDLELLEKIKRDFNKTVERDNLWFPDDKFPDADRARDDAIFQKGVKNFSDLFTLRNLLALSHLFKQVRRLAKTTEGKLCLLAFSDTLGWTSKMTNETGHGWQHHAYWLPYMFYECNVWEYFRRRFGVMLKGKEYTAAEINGFYKQAKDFHELRTMKTTSCLLLTRSSDDLPIPDGAIDAIVTDPPYGGNVQYLELSDFYLVWLKKVLKLDISSGIMLEAIETRHTNFPTEKSPEHYREMLSRIFKECHRVLRPNGWLVMTFHNKNFRIWNTLHSVVHDAGFLLSEEDGMIYQPPIMNYTQMLHTRATGAMLGDFILSFRKTEHIPLMKMVDTVEIGTKIRRIAAETIQYHGGARLTTIYLRLVPYLLNNGLLHKVGEQDVTKYLRDVFEERDGRWYFKENTTEVEGVTPLDYVPVESRIEYLIRSVFHEKEKATFDDIQTGIFTNLINSNAAEYEEITRVLQRIAIAEKNHREWELRNGASAAQTILSDWVDKEKLRQGKEEIPISSEISMHDFVIETLARIGKQRDFECHIGEKEQRTYLTFRKLSAPMGKNIYGMPDFSFDKIRQIDVLWLKGRSIVSAFEVENSTTINSGIDRFRELFAATPSLDIHAYIIVPDKRVDEAVKKIGSLANRQEGIHRKISVLKYSDLLQAKSPNIEDSAIHVSD